MGQSARAVIGAVAIIAGLWAIVVWCLEPRSGWAWAARFGMPAACAGCCVILAREARRKDVVPDFLGQRFGGCFERDGLCFVIEPVVDRGVWLLQIHLQNRYARPCEGAIEVHPPRGTFGIGRVRMPKLRVDVRCDGSGNSVARCAWGIPAKYQGRTIAFEVYADARYPDGRGDLVRFKDGTRCGPTPGASITFWSALFAILPLLGGIIVSSRPASWKPTLPTGVAEEVPPGFSYDAGVAEPPTRGFPVVPSVPAASPASSSGPGDEAEEHHVAG